MPVPKEKAAVFGLDRIKVEDINLIAKPEEDNFGNVIDLEITFSSNGRKWKVATKRQLKTKNWNKLFKVRQASNGGVYTQWNGYRLDLLAINAVWLKTGNESVNDVNEFIGFEFNGRVVEFTKDKKKQYFADWVVAFDDAGLPIPEPGDKDVYDPENLATKTVEKKDEEEDNISDKDLPF